MTMTRRILLFAAVTLGCVGAVDAAGPEFLEVFHADPLRRGEGGRCTTCHVDASGRGPRNEFGRALEANGGMITPLLRSQFPDRFVVRTTSAGDARIHFADPEGTSVVLEIDGEMFLVDVAARNVVPLQRAQGGTGEAPAAFEPIASVSGPMVVPAQPVEPSPAQPQSGVPVDQAAREGAVFGSRIVNLPSAKAVGDGGIEFLIGHRFTRALFESGSAADLFGFDSRAQVTFGVDYGATDWLSLGVMRANDRTFEFNSALQISSQGDSSPVSTQVRVGVDGRDNFSQQYAPYVQFVASRTFGDRLSLVLAPGVAFNTRNDSFQLPPGQPRFGAEHDYTASLGIGGSLRVLPTVSIVGEYVPRVSGFRGDFWDRPAVSFGVQKSTFRHTFEFVVSNTLPMTTSQYTVNGSDQFKVGFNIYRRLR